MEAEDSSKSSVNTYQTTQHHISEDSILQLLKHLQHTLNDQKFKATACEDISRIRVLCTMLRTDHTSNLTLPLLLILKEAHLCQGDVTTVGQWSNNEARCVAQIFMCVTELSITNVAETIFYLLIPSANNNHK
jgi:hypothetical protein